MDSAFTAPFLDSTFRIIHHHGAAHVSRGGGACPSCVALNLTGVKTRLVGVGAYVFDEPNPKKERGTAPPAVPRCERSRRARKPTDNCQRSHAGLRRKDKVLRCKWRAAQESTAPAWTRCWWSTFGLWWHGWCSLRDEAVSHHEDLDGIAPAGGWFVGLGLFKAVACLLKQFWRPFPFEDFVHQIPAFPEQGGQSGQESFHYARGSMVIGALRARRERHHVRKNHIKPSWSSPATFNPFEQRFCGCLQKITFNQ